MSPVEMAILLRDSFIATTTASITPPGEPNPKRGPKSNGVPKKLKRRVKKFELGCESCYRPRMNCQLHPLSPRAPTNWRWSVAFRWGIIFVAAAAIESAWPNLEPAGKTMSGKRAVLVRPEKRGSTW